MCLNKKHIQNNKKTNNFKRSKKKRMVHQRKPPISFNFWTFHADLFKASNLPKEEKSVDSSGAGDFRGLGSGIVTVHVILLYGILYTVCMCIYNCIIQHDIYNDISCLLLMYDD